MLVELAVRDLGVLADVRLAFGPGMTAVTGETGAGKTLVVEAIELLVGGRGDAVLVRPGAAEALVEGRFVTTAWSEAAVVDAAPGAAAADAEQEHVLSRTVAGAGGGRSRGYLDGRMCTVSALGEVGEGLVDLHGQHSHQSLLSTASQRDALDRFVGVDLAPRHDARARLRAIDDQLAGLGGDARARAREIDLLRFQLEEIEGARLEDMDEDARLEAEEDRLAAASAHREAAEQARAALADDDGAVDALGRAVSVLAGRAPLEATESQLRDLVAAVQEAAVDLRRAAEELQDDPARLEQVRARRHLLRELQRKYGSSLAEVLDFAVEAQRRLDELQSHEGRVAELQAERQRVTNGLVEIEGRIGRQRRKGAARLAEAVEANLHDLAMPRATMQIEVGAGAGDDVSFLLAANAGEPARPLAKVASGGELARAMLALRLVLSTGPPTLIFDEVDAGIGGEAAVAVGRALAALAADRQVLVVTHLAQVAAFADYQVGVAKREAAGRTIAEASLLEGPARVAELARMLSGQPGSAAARRHAKELLAQAGADRSHRAPAGLR